MRKFIFPLLLAILFAQCEGSSSSGNPVADKIAEVAGLDNFEKVGAMEFTFNVQRDSTVSSRHWKWMPKTNDVSFSDGKDSLSFKRYDTSTTRLKELNALFTNDEYWLLFPFHLVWDKGMDLTDNGVALAPVTGDSLHKMTVTYNKTDGFTPGDMYVIYAGEDNRIKEWEFHKGASAEPSLMTTWADYSDFNGLQLATDHRSKDGGFRLFFTDIKVSE